MNFRLSSHISLVLTLLGMSSFGGHASAKDAFGLDRYKVPAEAITKPALPYRTRFGSPISVYSITTPDLNIIDKNPPLKFLIQGGLHGNELLGSEFVSWLAQRFSKGESLLNKLNRGNVAVDFVPYANPDGTIQFTRGNGNKINLNRNFGVLWGLTKENPGPAAFSEPETRAIRDLFAKQNYTGAIDVHGYINWVVVPTAPEDGLSGLPKADAKKMADYRRWTQAVKNETAANLPGYEIKSAGSLGDGGAFEDFAWWGAGVPAACLEIFSTDRFVAQSMAAKLVDILTPRAFGRLAANFDSTDMFLVYENYINSLFIESIHIKTGDEPTHQMAAATPQR